jgi:hypothetical protein
VDTRFIAYPQIAAQRQCAIYRVSANRSATSMRDLSRISRATTQYPANPVDIAFYIVVTPFVIPNKPRFILS